MTLVKHDDWRLMIPPFMIIMALKTNRMPSTFIDEHSYKGLKGRVILSQIN